MDLVVITKEIYESAKRLENGSKQIFHLAKEQAEKERVYRKALVLEIMRLKDEGMSISLINEIARGNTADLKYERDLAEASYVAGRDSLKAIATQMNGLQSILRIQREIEGDE